MTFTVNLANGGKVQAESVSLGPGGVLMVQTTDKRNDKKHETLYPPGSWAKVVHELD